MSEFVQCLDLCRPFYFEAVRPIMEGKFPHLPYSAAVLGRGSDMKRLDDEVSRDHGWGPFVMIFLREEDLDRSQSLIYEALDKTLPPTFLGHKVGIHTEGPDSRPGRGTFVTSPRLLSDYMNFDLDDEIQPIDWLTFAQHRLLDLVSGEVYHDDIGLQALRDKLVYYPRDIWLYLMLASWVRIRQEEPLMGRAGSMGDELGASVIASRLVREIMRLCFLMEKQYAPYPKLYGTAFRNLKSAAELMEPLQEMQFARTWNDRERHFEVVWKRLAAIHNAHGITEPIEVECPTCGTRPYRFCNITCGSGDVVEAFRKQLQDPRISRLTMGGITGGIDHVSDNTHILDNPSWRGVLRSLYEPAAS